MLINRNSMTVKEATMPKYEVHVTSFFIPIY